ncbi:MAG: 5'-nucleotidase C-terminal domain-containing protein [Kaiparowitsia implicata GSE-PSE-MK54-09C]|jgi:5'-nucleotidase|nr:5'-nucleotidase C-terminal domain-containing protein [Kaiparowitsia implicata GSE-PSE-MK54-09C]
MLSLRRLWGGLVLALAGFLLVLSTRPAASQAPAFSLQILHTNDHHARIEPAGDLGGVARRKTLFDQVRAEATIPTLTLDAGDIFQGTLYFTQFQGQADLEFYNALDYDAVTVGNHEFDAGAQTLADFIDGAEFPMISANLVVDERSPLVGKIQPWIIQDVAGQRVGIFGLTPEDTAILSSPGEGVTFVDAVEAAQQAVADLQAEGVDKIIGLTHVGLGRDRQIAQRVEGIDVIVGGHSHTPLGDMPGASAPYPVIETSPSGEDVVIVTDWEWGNYVGVLTVDFNAAGEVVSWEESPQAVDETLVEDATFLEQIAVYAEPLEELRQTVIGQSLVDLEGDRTVVRIGETNLANLVADAMLEKMRPDGAEMVITNGGGIRASIPAGEITIGQVLEVLPFGNTLAIADLTGLQVVEALESGLSQVEEGAGRFPQVAGLRFTFDPAAAVGQRVTTLCFIDADGTSQSLQADTIYRVVTNNFMLNGGDGYAVFTDAQNPYVTGFDMADSVVDYIQTNSPINLDVDGRIQQS